MPQGPAVVFDFGGVLLEWNPRHLYRKLFDDEVEMEHFLATVCTPDWNVRQDSGRPFGEAVAELVEKHPGYAPLIRAYHERWEEMIPHAIEGTVEILRDVYNADYPLAALSNWSAETFPLVKRRFEFFSWFDLIVLSGEELCIKPDRRIYEILLQRLDRPAGDCIFIDDSEKNVAAAREIGMQVIHFRSPEELRLQLRQSGLPL
jgi:2-haloacid dehalogenase